MSTDIITNQLPKDILNSSSVAQSSNAPPAEAEQNRQNTAVEDGNVLPSEAETGEASGEELQQAVTQLNDHMQQIQRDLLFSVDDSSGHTVVRVVDSTTEEVVRQIPSEEALRISRNIKDQLDDVTGLLVKTSA